MRFKDYFSKDFESSDNSFYESLRTRYYRAKYEDAKKKVLEIISEEKGKVLDENEDYREILFETSGYSCTVCFVPTTPVEIAIDFKVTTFNFLGMGKGKKIIEELYKKVDARLPLKGIALYK